MELAKVSSKGQVTIPKKVRNALGIRQGDILRLEVEGDHAVLTRVAGGGEGDLKALAATLDEWTTDDDEEAYRDL
jgi:AbrB family looped-hinge helix DNA binding protein